MKTQHQKELYVGITVLVALAVIIGVIFWGNSLYVANRTQTVQARFDNVGGLTKGDPVSVSGVAVGRVAGVKIVRDSVRVKMKIRKVVELRRDADVAIVAAELMGGKMVEINPGSSPRKITPGSVIVGRYIPGVTEIAGVLRENRDDINSIMNDLSETVHSLRLILGQDSGELSSIGSIMKNLSNTTLQLDSILQINALNVQKTIRNMEQISTTLNMVVQGQRERAITLLAAGEQLATRLNHLADSSQVLIDRLNNPHTSAGRVLRSDSLYNQILKSLQSIDSLVTDFQKHPERYLENVQVKFNPF